MGGSRPLSMAIQSVYSAISVNTVYVGPRQPPPPPAFLQLTRPTAVHLCLCLHTWPSHRPPASTTRGPPESPLEVIN